MTVGHSFTLPIYLSSNQKILGTCIFGWVGLIALAGLMFKALDYGGGVDLWNVPKAKYKRFTKVVPILTIRYFG